MRSLNRKSGQVNQGLLCFAIRQNRDRLNGGFYIVMGFLLGALHGIRAKNNFQCAFMISSLLHILIVTPVIFLWLRDRELRNGTLQQSLDHASHE